jgi:hypothetical protein
MLGLLGEARSRIDPFSPLVLSEKAGFVSKTVWKAMVENKLENKKG